MKVMSDEPNIRQRLADNLRRLRKERGWSHEDLAAVGQIHRTQIGKIEQARQNTGIDIIERLAKTFGIQPGDLLNSDSPQPSGGLSDNPDH